MFKNKKTLSVVSLFILTVVSTVFFILPMFKSQAGAFGSVYFYLSRMKVNLNGVAPNTVEYVVTFTPLQNIPTGGTVTVAFPDGDDSMWCRTTGALTVAGVTSSAADQTGTGWQIDASLPGTLTASCTTGSTGTTDIITISGVTALTAGTTYGVKITNGTGVIGTDDTAGNHEVTITASSGAVSDSKTFGVQLVTDDQVVITADVAAAPNVTCSISSNSVNLGTLYPGGAYATGTHTLSTTTSTTAGGYYWTVYGQGDGATDAGLWKSTATTHLIPSTGSTTIDLRVVATEGFGMTASDPDGGTGAVVATDFADTTLGVFGALDRGPAGAQLLLSQIGAQTTPEDSTITYGAKAGSAAVVGSYQETVTFVCGGYY